MIPANTYKIYFVILMLSITNQSYLGAQTTDNISAKEISKKSSDKVEFKNIEMDITLKIYSPTGSERTRKIFSASGKFENVNKMLLRFTEPADYKGTAMLIFDYDNKSDEMWIYLPSLRKTRRIVSSEKGNNFMGSEFSNADMSKPNLDDFVYKLLGSNVYDGNDCWKIEITPNDSKIAEEYGFRKKISFIDKSDYLCQKIEIYDLKGRLLKTEFMGKYKKVSESKYLAYYLEIKNEQNGRKSIISIDRFKEGTNLKESEFSPARLE